MSEEFNVHRSEGPRYFLSFSRDEWEQLRECRESDVSRVLFRLGKSGDGPSATKGTLVPVNMGKIARLALAVQLNRLDAYDPNDQDVSMAEWRLALRVCVGTFKRNPEINHMADLCTALTAGFRSGKLT